MDTRDKLIELKDIILEKEFRTQINGYNPKEVDEFYDSIFQKLNEFIVYQEQIINENNLLKKDREKILKENSELKNQLDFFNHLKTNG